MSDRKFYRTVIQFEILAEEPIPDCLNLEQIHYETMEGHWSGHFLASPVDNEECDGPRMAMLLQAQGSDPEFFQLTETGEDCEEAL